MTIPTSSVRIRASQESLSILALSKIRRLLIAVVGFLLFVNVILLGVAKFGSAQAVERDRKFDVVAWADKADVAKATKAELEAAGRTVDLSEAKREQQIPNGYRLVMTGDPGDLKSFLEAMKFKKHPVKLVSEGRELQYGNVYQDKAKAEKQAKAVLKSDGFNFRVQESYKTVTKPAQKLVVLGLDEKTANEVDALLQGKGLDSEVQPAKAESSTGEPG